MQVEGHDSQRSPCKVGRILITLSLGSQSEACEPPAVIDVNYIQYHCPYKRHYFFSACVCYIGHVYNYNSLSQNVLLAPKINNTLIRELKRMVNHWWSDLIRVHSGL